MFAMFLFKNKYYGFNFKIFEWYLFNKSKLLMLDLNKTWEGLICITIISNDLLANVKK